MVVQKSIVVNVFVIILIHKNKKSTIYIHTYVPLIGLIYYIYIYYMSIQTYMCRKLFLMQISKQNTVLVTNVL